MLQSERWTAAQQTLAVSQWKRFQNCCSSLSHQRPVLFPVAGRDFSGKHLLSTAELWKKENGKDPPLAVIWYFWRASDLRQSSLSSPTTAVLWSSESWQKRYLLGKEKWNSFIKRSYILIENTRFFSIAENKGFLTANISVRKTRCNSFQLALAIRINCPA